MMGRYHLSDDAHPEDLMRPVSFLLVAAVMLAACDTATAPRSMHSSVDDSGVPAELRAAYLEDANRLALRDLLARGPPEPINIIALAQLFSGISGVRFAEPNGVVGDGNDITGSVEDSRVLLDYSVGYGDCPSGCIGRRFYHFAVHDDGTVDYLGATGSPPPRPGQP